MLIDNHLLVFSHLRWDFVYQRPQHLLSRLASWRRILFIEEPYYVPDEIPSWECTEPAPNVRVARLCTPVPSPGFHDDHLSLLLPMLYHFLSSQRIMGYVAWFYTPMALPLLEVLTPQAIVYDCMDELSQFAGAPPELLEREARLFEQASLVFTGGPSLYKAKQDRHPNVHCFPSSVDLVHFGQAREGAIEPEDQAAIPHPRLGFYGVIDERLDVPLLDALARAHPDWQIVMIGPVAKIDPDLLPRHPNIHYLGQRTYDQLPAYLSGWDVCLLPFARNQATRFISPTKTLEYMAAERPIVSTPITDVAEPYGDIVYLGDTPEEFIGACEQALASSEHERLLRATKMRSVLSKTSWDRTAQAMRVLIEQALAAQEIPRAA